MERRFKFLDKDRAETIASLINDALIIAIRETGMRQWQIAETIGVSENTISRWRKGWSMPRDRDFEKLLAFLGQLDPPITEDFFSGSYKNDPYIDDPDYVAAIGKELKQYANEIGLNLNFLRFVTDVLKKSGTDKDFYFYQWGPIHMKENTISSDPEKLNVHERLTIAESRVAKAAGDFRVADRVLSKVDLKVIEEVQELAIKVMALSFIKRNIDMIGEVKKANEVRRNKYLKAREKAKGSELSPKDMTLTVGEMAEIDKYYKEFIRDQAEEMPDDNTLITDLPWEVSSTD